MFTSFSAFSLITTSRYPFCDRLFIVVRWSAMYFSVVERTISLYFGEATFCDCGKSWKMRTHPLLSSSGASRGTSPGTLPTVPRALLMWVHEMGFTSEQPAGRYGGRVTSQGVEEAILVRVEPQIRGGALQWPCVFLGRQCLRCHVEAGFSRQGPFCRIPAPAGALSQCWDPTFVLREAEELVARGFKGRCSARGRVCVFSVV